MLVLVVNITDYIGIYRRESWQYTGSAQPRAKRPTSAMSQEAILVPIWYRQITQVLRPKPHQSLLIYAKSFNLILLNTGIKTQ